LDSQQLWDNICSPNFVTPEKKMRSVAAGLPGKG
jgi:hypothetical protein